MEKTKIKLTKGDLIFLGILSILSTIFTICWMALTGNTPQVYKDIVIDWTAVLRSNKSAEILLLRILILSGAIAVVFWTTFKKRKIPKTLSSSKNDIAKNFITRITNIIKAEIIVSTLCLYFLSFYTFYALYQFFNFLKSYKIINFPQSMENIPSHYALIFAILCTGLSLLTKKRNILQKRTILALQLVLPALFLILSLKDYDYQGNIVSIGIPLQAKIFIGCAVILSFVNALKVLKNSWASKNSEISSFISISACISIMCFNSYSGYGVVVSDDIHHPFENIFAFQQIFELGQIPYKDFIPPSGLYSVIEGTFFKLFGNGDIANYNLCNNIFFYTIIALTFILLQFHIKKIWCFAITLLLQFPLSNRTSFMTSIILLFLLPPLVKHVNLWLKVFLLVNLFHGLYYPLHGVSCFVGFLPLFVVQIKKLITDENKSYRSAKFWIGWLGIFAIILASIPLLWGTFVHILAMSGQSVLADGISIFGQRLPKNFMPHRINILRYSIYNGMRIVPLALMVWLPFLFLSKALSTGRKGYRAYGKIFEDHIEFFTTVISLILIPLISYTFTFVRVDMYNVFARSGPALFCVVILSTVFIVKHAADNSSRCFIALILLTVQVISQGLGFGFTKQYVTGKPVLSAIKVPENYILVEKFEPDYGTIGKCFLDKGMMNTLHKMKDKINDKRTFGMGLFGYWYIFKQKGGANIEATVMKGFGAAKETRTMLLKNKVFSGSSMGTFDHYYIYNWLVASGEYVWDNQQNLYIPNENLLDHNEVKKRNASSPMWSDTYNLGNSADVFGLSFKTLKKIFTEKEIP